MHTSLCAANEPLRHSERFVPLMRIPPCKICGTSVVGIGAKSGKIQAKSFQYFRCPACRFAFVGEPWTEFEKIYSQSYYEGNGAEPVAEYVYELEHPEETVRRFEWHGLLRLIRGLLRKTDNFDWLDYGCGNGGLVRFVSQSSSIRITGLEEGWIAQRAREKGISVVDRSQAAACGPFDVVTAIEVIEHVVDPLETLRDMRTLLKPGGLLFLTTGNARLHRERLLDWPYVIPEIHISLFEPKTLEIALQTAGFRPEYPGFRPGHAEIIQARTLKNLQVRNRSPWQTVLAWEPVARAIGARVGFTEHPIGWAK